MLELSVRVTLSRILPGVWTAVEKPICSGQMGVRKGQWLNECEDVGVREQRLHFEDRLCHFSGIWSKLKFFKIKEIIMNHPFIHFS